MTIVEEHLKVVDTWTQRLFDVLSEPNFDKEAVNGMGFTRSGRDRVNKLLMLCHVDNKSYVQYIEFNAILPFSLDDRIKK